MELTLSSGRFPVLRDMSFFSLCLSFSPQEVPKPLALCLRTAPPFYLYRRFGAELIEDDVGEYIHFTTTMIVRLGVTWILPAMYPCQAGDSPAYAMMLFSWSILGVFRNFQRSWRRTRVIGGWESGSLSLYISLVALRYVDSPQFSKISQNLVPSSSHS